MLCLLLEKQNKIKKWIWLLLKTKNTITYFSCLFFLTGTSPIEVKSGKNYTLNSLKKFRNKYPRYLHTSYVLHTNDVKEEDDIMYLPVYMTPLL